MSPTIGRALWLWAPVVLYMAVIFAVSAMPEPPAPPGANDKVLHLVAYGGLGLVLARATAGGTLAGVTARAAVAAWVIATIYGATDEFHQGFVPGRTREFLDLVADAAGAGLAIGLAWLSGILWRSRRARAASFPPS